MESKTKLKVSDIVDLDLPIKVLIDIDKRITDWVSMGGSEEDPYMQRQVEYAKQVHNLVNGV